MEPDLSNVDVVVNDDLTRAQAATRHLVGLGRGRIAHVRRPFHGWLTMSTEISTAGIVPLFSSQWVVFRSSGQPTPGP